MRHARGRIGALLPRPALGRSRESRTPLRGLRHGLRQLYRADRRSRLFDTIIVVTDRRVLDQQLQNTIKQFEQTKGTVVPITKTSAQLREALQQGKDIVVTTLQKFPVISETMVGTRGAEVCRHHRRGTLVAVGGGCKAPQEDPLCRTGGCRGGRRGREGRRLGGQGRAGDPHAETAAGTHLVLCLHCHPEEQDPRTLRSEGREREVRPVPHVLDAAGNRGGVHPRRAEKLHHLQEVLQTRQVHRGRRGVRDAEGSACPHLLRGPDRPCRRDEGTDHASTTSST